MAIPRTIEVTLNLPVDIIERIDEASAITNQTADQIIAGSLISTLPGSRDQAKDKIERLFRRFSTLSDKELEARLNAQLSAKEQDRLSDLQELNGEGQLTAQETGELWEIIARTEEIALERGAAFRELRERGKNPILKPPKRLPPKPDRR